MPTPARKPCSGCVRSRRMISISALVLRPIAPASRRSALMARRHVLAHRRMLAVGARAHMRSNALAVVEDFDRARGDARPNFLTQQLVRDRVVVLVDFDVIIETDPALLPFGKDVWLNRQRLERGALPLLEQH